MKKKLRLLSLLMTVPALFNMAVSVFIFMKWGMTLQLCGYAAGTVFSIILSAMWIWQAGRMLGSNAMEMLKSLGLGFLLKMAALILVLFCGYFFRILDIAWFAAAFFVSVFYSALVELWMYFSLLREKSPRS
jgi:hypothetical protein